MLNTDGLFFDAEAELKPKKKGYIRPEDEILDLFKKLPKNRQRAVLAVLWDEIKPPEKPNTYRYRDLPY